MRQETYWGGVGQQFRKNRIAVCGLGIVLILFSIAAFADFIANDKPLLMRYQGRTYFPVIADYAFRLGIGRWERQFQNVSFKEFTAKNFSVADWAWFPPIRYSQNDVNLD